MLILDIVHMFCILWKKQKQNKTKTQKQKHKQKTKNTKNTWNSATVIIMPVPVPSLEKGRGQVCRTAETLIWIALKLFCQCKDFYFDLVSFFICACLCTYNVHNIYFKWQINILPIWLVGLYQSSHIIYKVTMS